MVNNISNTMIFTEKPNILSYASVVGKKEAQGPLKDDFDKIIYDAYGGKETFEQAESALVSEAVTIALQKGGFSASDIEYAFCGDLLNQCIASSFGMRNFQIPYIGVYGACSTMALGLILSSITIESGACQKAICAASSHFCSAERQYRFPLEYGGQRPPTTQWTVTGAGCCVLSKHTSDNKPYIHSAQVGSIIDMGITDQNNMGAAMAPAAADTICKFLNNTNTRVEDYDMIYTGDLGKIGSKLLYELLEKKDIDIKSNHKDCGVMIFQNGDMDVHAGGSGCGCCASVLCGHILNSMCEKKQRNILFIPTGALLSPTTVLQKESIPSIAHLVNIRI